MRVIEELGQLIGAKGIKMLDLRFTNLYGRWHHITLPVSQLDDSLLTEGVGFDASSIPGFGKRVHGGDKVLVPDFSTAQLDPFCDPPTLGIICNIAEAGTLEPFANDPRTVAGRAEALLVKEGIADGSLWSPEFEFYVFDRVVYQNDVNVAHYRVDSEEAEWNSCSETSDGLAAKLPLQGGYHAMPPLDKLAAIRSRMVMAIEEAGIPVRYHHHEVGGPGQSEIEISLMPLEEACDAAMIIKHITRMVAHQHGKTVTYMPKPLYNVAGNGMHFHQFLVRDGRSLFYDREGYAGLSTLAHYYIGGLLKHSRALLALTNPSTNSYKRLVPGFEAPVSLVYGLANRSAAVRIPKYVDNEKTKRIEYRPPDGTCNVYLAAAAQLMAGIDGILEKIDPVAAGYGPYDINLYDLPRDQLEKIGQVPTSLKESLEALEADHAFLLRGGVFNESMLQTWIEKKLSEDYEEVQKRPHPYEIKLYFDL